MKKGIFIFFLVCCIKSSGISGKTFIKFHKFSYGIRIIPANTSIKNFSLYLPLPATTKNQKLIKYKVNIKKYKIITSKIHKAKYLYFNFKRIPANKKNLDIYITVEVLKKQKKNNLKSILYTDKNYKNKSVYRFLRFNNYINNNHKLIKNLTSELKGASIYYQIKYLTERINSLIKKRARFRGLRKVSHILKYMDGECSDYVTVMASVLRNLKIPCRHVVGRIITNDIKKSWHIWAEVYTNKLGWVPVDPFYYNTNKSLIGYEPDDYIIFHKGILLPKLKRKNKIPILQSYYYTFTYKGRPNIKVKYIWKK